MLNHCMYKEGADSGEIEGGKGREGWVPLHACTCTCKAACGLYMQQVLCDGYIVMLIFIHVAASQIASHASVK